MRMPEVQKRRGKIELYRNRLRWADLAMMVKSDPGKEIREQMSGEWNIDSVVERLEKSLVPELAGFARVLMKSNEGIITETVSLRHASCVHTLGLRCRPAGKNEFDPNTVALVVHVIAVTRLTLRGFVQRQRLSASPEACTPVYHQFSDRKFAKFEQEVRDMFPMRCVGVRPTSLPISQGRRRD